MEYKLTKGDIVIDIVTGDVGLLLRRYSLIEDVPSPDLNVYAWDIYWSGPTTAQKSISRYQPYTESGLYLSLIHI